MKEIKADEPFWLDKFVDLFKLKTEVVGKEMPLSFDQSQVIICVEGQITVSLTLQIEETEPKIFETLFRLERGELCVIPESCDYNFVATGSSDASMLSIPLLKFCDSFLRALTARGFDQSINLWAETLVNQLPPPKGTIKGILMLARGQDYTIKSGQYAVAAKGHIVWLPSVNFDLAVLEDSHEVPLERMSWPLTDRFPICCKKDLSVKAKSSRRLFASASGAEILNQLACSAIKKIAAQHEKRLGVDQKLMVDKYKVRQLQVETSLSQLTSLLSPGFHGKPSSNDPLILCCYELIQRQGWIPKVPRSLDTTKPMNFIKSMADSSDLSIRHARLPDKWWHSDYDSFLAYDQQGNAKVVYKNLRGYFYWDPITEKKYRITDSNADQFQNEVVYFYKNFEHKKLTIKDLVYFELPSVRNEIFALLLLAVLSAGITNALPLCTAFIINIVIPGAYIPLLWTFVIAIVFIGFFKVSFQWLHQIFLIRMNSRMDLKVSAALWDKILHLPARVLASFSAGDLSSRINSLTGIHSFLRVFIQGSVFHVIQITFSLGLMLWINFPLGILAFAVAFIAFIIAIGFSHWRMRAFMGGERSLGIVNSYILEIFSGIQKIRNAAAEVSVYQQWAQRFSRIQKKTIKSTHIANYYNAFNTFWSALTIAVIYYLMVALQNQTIPLGSFIAFLAAYATVSASLSALSSLLMGASMQIPMIKYVEPILLNLPEIRSNKIWPKSLTGNLNIEAISFSYPGQMNPAVSSISMQIPQGSFTAIVGVSGSGKSTLLRLIAALERPVRGRVFMDEYDVQMIDRHLLREQMGFVQQNYKLLPGSLFENIKGASDASPDAVREAARLACIEDDINELPMGMHTMVGADAQVFSGGQIQRLAIARALVRKPSILIFDESTSALDNELQARIMKNIIKMNCSIICVAHRLNLVKNADQIFVMSHGVLIDKGKWHELLQKEGVFKEMVKASIGE